MNSPNCPDFSVMGKTIIMCSALSSSLSVSKSLNYDLELVALHSKENLSGVSWKEADISDVVVTDAKISSVHQELTNRDCPKTDTK